jgi:hypothetical protein
MLCATPLDALSDPARALLFLVAKPHLESARLTTTELVFDPREQRKLLNAGTRYQEYIQRIAVLQGKTVKAPVTERVKDLLGVTDGAAKLVEASLKRLPADGSIDAEKLDEAVAEGAEGFVVAGAMLALWLSLKPDWTGKAELCAHLFKGAKAPYSVALLDRTLAELLTLEAASAALGVGYDNALATLRMCLALAGEPVASGETTPLIRALVAARGARVTPALDLATRDRLRAALASPASFAKRDPAGEMKMARGLRARIAALPLLAGDSAISEELARRFARMVAPESLEPVLAREQGVARKLQLLLQLHTELDDPGARRSLESAIANWLAYRDFKDEFFAVGQATDEKAAALADTAKAFAAAQLPDAIKLRFKELAAVSFAAPQAGDRRISPRMVAGPEDKIQAMGQRVPLRNWSETGLLFGPAANFAPGHRLSASVILRNAYLNLVFDAELEIVRVADGLIGARYTCLDAAARAKIKTHFAGR